MNLQKAVQTAMFSFAGEIKTGERSKNAPGFTCITSIDDLMALYDEIVGLGYVAIDTETTSLNVGEAEIVGVSFATSSRHGYYIPIGHIDISTRKLDSRQLPADEVLSVVKAVVEDKNLHHIWHNAAYDLSILIMNGMSPATPFFDTIVSSWFLKGGSENYSRGLKSRVMQDVGYKMQDIDGLLMKGTRYERTFDLVPIDEATPYASDDAAMTFALFIAHKELLRKEKFKPTHWNMEMGIALATAHMQCNGVVVDNSKLMRMDAMIDKEMHSIHRKINTIAARHHTSINNPNASPQICKLVYHDMGFKHPDPTQEAKRHNPKTRYNMSASSGAIDKTEELIRNAWLRKNDFTEGEWKSEKNTEVRRAEQDENVVSLIKEYKHLIKMRGSYVNSVKAGIAERTGRFHPSLNAWGTVTARYTEKILLALPKSDLGMQFRSCVVAPPGHKFIAVDYSRAEVYLMVNLAREETMMRAIRDGLDIHQANASKMYDVPYENVTKKQRDNGKRITFGLLYGISKYGLAEQMGITVEEADEQIVKYMSGLPAVKRFIDECHRFAKRNGYAWSHWGIRFQLKALQSPPPKEERWKVNADLRRASNFPIQAGVSYYIRKALVRMNTEMLENKFNGKLTLVVHDEIVCVAKDEDAYEVGRQMKMIMEEVTQILELPFQADVSIGRSLMEVKLEENKVEYD